MRQCAGNPGERFFCIAVAAACLGAPSVPPARASAPEPRSRTAPTVEFDADGPRAELALRQGHGVLFTDSVKINGRRGGHFLVDTGSDVTVVAPSVARDLGLVGQRQAAQPAGGPVDAFAVAESVSLGPLTIRKYAVGVMDLTFCQKFSRPVAGILGMDVLGRVPFALDYRRREIVLYDPRRFDGRSEGVRFPLIAAGRRSTGRSDGGRRAPVRPAVEGELNGLRVTWMLDTGLSRGVFIAPRDACRQAARIGRPVHPLREVSSADDRERRMHTFEVDELRLLAVRRRDVPFAVTPDPEACAESADALRPRASAVGGTLLREFRLTFNMPARELWVSSAAMPEVAGDAVETTNFAGVPPVVEALAYADADALKVLLAHGASLDHADEAGYNVLHDAVIGGSRRCLEMLLSAEGRPELGAATFRGVTPLILAAGLCESDLVELMLEAGADANARTATGHAPLHAAAEAGCLDAARLLLACGAKPDVTQADGQPAMALAAGKGHADMVRLLLRSGADADWTADNGGNVLHFAAYGGNADILAMVLERAGEAPVDQASSIGATPLMIAAQRGHVAFARGLLKAGADPGRRTGRHAALGAVAPIHYASMEGRSDVVRLLLANDVPPDQETGNGLTPLMLAAGVGDVASVKALLDAGARVDKSDRQGMTALHYAAKRGRPAAMPLLLRAGARVEAVADRGVRPLDFAALQGDGDVARVLVVAGADPAGRGPHGGSAIELAERRGHALLATMLRRLADDGAEPASRRDGRQTPPGPSGSDAEMQSP